MECARAQGQDKLAMVFQQNLDEERGMKAGKVVEGLDQTFPEIGPADRFYIDDHAQHDGHHYKALRGALEKIVESLPASEKTRARQSILEGARRIVEAKRRFFGGIPVTS